LSDFDSNFWPTEHGANQGNNKSHCCAKFAVYICFVMPSFH